MEKLVMKVRAPWLAAGRPGLAHWPARVVALGLLLFVLLLVGAGPRVALGQTTDGPLEVVKAPAAPAQTGVIAYVESTNRDEIRLIAPDGTGDRRLWAHGQADPHDVYEVISLAWRPNVTDLAFASSHENWCSINQFDIFTVASDGGNYRRITQAPSCAALAGYPKGTVRIPVKNDNIFGDSFAGFAYFQGASTILPLTLPPFGTTTLTFNNVADFGPGVPQLATMIVGSNRDISGATEIDVLPGQTVTTGQMSIYLPEASWEARDPTWRSDGSSIGYVYNFASLFRLPPNPQPLDLGSKLQTDVSVMPDFVDLLTWGPPSKANQLLYVGNRVFDSEGIYLMNEGSATAGQKLLSYETYEQVRGLAWLPDGSGFVYSVEEVDDTFTSTRANIFLYRFAGGGPVRLTNFSNQFATQLSVSPDGSQVVFARAALQDSDAPTDLWIMNINGTGQRLLKSKAGSPAWSPGALAVPQKAYLPSVQRP